MIIGLFTGCGYGKAPVEEKVRTEISILYPRDGGGGIIRLLKDYEKLNDDITIKAFEVPGERDRYFVGLTTVISAGQKMPDILVLHDTWMPELAAKGILKQLDDVFSSDIETAFFPGMAEAGRWEGKLFGIPFWQDMPLLYYRTDLVDSPPNTWKKLENTAADVKSKLGIQYGLIFPAKSQWNRTVFMTSLLISHNAMPDFSGQTINYDRKALSSALSRLKTLVTKEVLSSDVLTMGPEGCRQAFSEGNAVFMINWSYAARLFLKDGSPLKDMFAAAPIPMEASDDAYSSLISGWILTIGDQSRHTAQAKGVIEYLAGYANQRRIALENGQLPAREDLYAETDWQDKLCVPQVLAAALPAGRPARLGINLDNRMDVLNSVLSKAFDSGAKASDLEKLLTEGIVPDKQATEVHREE